jgi:hypothetical protein
VRLEYLRRAPIVLWLLLGCTSPALAQVSINFSLPGTTIGLNLGGYPTLQRIPGYPVYYAPGVNSNFFFYDGMYWVFQDDNWYASSWYNGPWGLVDAYYVPDYILRVPVRYYRHAPAYFRGWRADAPPRWGEHWGRSWVERRRDWDRWDRKSSPPPAPLPTYQRNYRGERYPHASQQADLHTRNYRYQPREAIAREHFQERRSHSESSRPRQDERAQRADERRGQEAQRPQREQRQEVQRQQREQQARPQPPEQRPQGNERGRAPESQGRDRNETTQQRNERLGAGG